MICFCLCHREAGVFHCLPCCSKCPDCKQDIVSGFMEEHQKECPTAKAKQVAHLIWKRTVGRNFRE